MTDAPVTFIGGARVGFWNVTWPFARLRVSKDELEIWILGQGTLRFRQEAVVRVTKYVSLPFVGWGVKIEPKLSAYPEDVIFWYFGRPETLMKAIEETGFRAGG